MNRIEEINKFLEETPNDPFLHYALTMEYVKLEEWDMARVLFQKLVDEYPDYVGTYYHFGKLLEKVNEKEFALTIYQKGIEIARSKRNFHALNELQGAYNLANGFDEDEEY